MVIFRIFDWLLMQLWLFLAGIPWQRWIAGGSVSAKAGQSGQDRWRPTYLRWVKGQTAAPHWAPVHPGALKIATGLAVYHPPGNLRVGALLPQ